MTMEQLATFLGWCTVINFSILIFGTIFMAIAKDWAMSVHSRILDIDKADLPQIYMKFLAYFKMTVLIFNFTPYLALQIMI